MINYHLLLILKLLYINSTFDAKNSLWNRKHDEPLYCNSSNHDQRLWFNLKRKNYVAAGQHHDFSRFLENRTPIAQPRNGAARALARLQPLAGRRFGRPNTHPGQPTSQPSSQGPRNSTLAAAAVLLPWKYYIRSLTRSRTRHRTQKVVLTERCPLSLSLPTLGGAPAAQFALFDLLCQPLHFGYVRAVIVAIT